MAHSCDGTDGRLTTRSAGARVGGAVAVRAGGQAGAIVARRRDPDGAAVTRTCRVAVRARRDAGAS